LSGVDTLINANSGSGFKPGFDFIEQKACTTSFDYPGCHNHFLFNLYSYPKWYWHIVIDGGYGAKMGKVNLDSLKTAPSDLEFQKSPARADSIPPDSLASRVGNSYWIKTGNDPRPAWAGVYYAKIRVLNFRVIDSASRKVEMVFLWAYNGTGVRGVTTSGLDTFHFDNTAAQARRGYSGAASLSAGGALKVVGDRFTVPQELVGSGVVLGVYDLRGKRLGRITVGNRKTIDLGAIAGKGRGGIVVVRGE
jgi:hypothetical protein